MFEEAIIYRSCVSTSLAEGKAVWQQARSGAQRAAAAEMKAACDAVFERLYSGFGA
ncbi:hypothetical protein ACFQDN_22015 [Pseudomonas asuensis]